jgi:D-glycero-D-manno-heptose 1,7-bisphosphate phosphatase
LTASRRAVFLDRDGVLDRRPPPHEYVTSVEALEVLPGVPEAVASLRAAGYLPIVVSNQRGVARGLVGEEVLAAIERKLLDAGVAVEAFYYCRHDLDEGCDCRKPRPGLLLQAAREHGVDLRASVMVGDEETDVEAGRAAGCRTVRIGPAGTTTAADVLASDLAAAAELVAARFGGAPGPATVL